MASENISARQSVYVRLLLLLLGEVIIGLFLYAIFTFVPLAVQMTIAVAAWLIIANNIFFPERNKSLASELYGITAIPAFSCYVAWRITHGDFWLKLMLVGSCLMAALIFLDRREEG